MTALAVKANRTTIGGWRWRTPAWLAVTVLALAGLGAVLERSLTDPHQFPVRVIEVRGEFRQLDQTRLEQEVAAGIGNGFVSTDMADIRSRVERFAWVDSLELRRIWPDRLRMTVSEQVPVARWGSDGLVNAQGGVFRPQPPVRPADMPVLHAADDAAPKVIAFLDEIRPKLQAAGLQVESIRLDGRGDWRVALKGGPQLAIGPEQPAGMLQRFLDLYPALLQETGREPVRVDLRYGHGVAVRWKLSGANVTERTSGGTPR